MSFVAEVHRRKVFKVGAAYVVIAWLVVQVASIALPTFGAPPWALRVFILVLMLGFPIAVVMAWVFDVSADGLKRDDAPIGNKRVYAAALALGLLAVAWYFVGTPAVREGRSKADTVGTAVPAGSQPTTAAAPPDKSIAVLAFTDLSPTKDQEYFSDGISEEILNALVKVKELRVAGRTSSFHYKGRNEDLRAIGRALGVAYIVEGSVRKQGDRVRITAQLIRSADGFHLWSERYDGEMTDVFELQDRIARAIADALAVVLVGEQKTRLVPVATTSPEAYALYLRATDAMHKRDYPLMGEAIGWLEEALRLDPSFARGEARLALIHVMGQSRYGSSLDKAEVHARRAHALDPKLAEPLYALANVARYRRQFMDARELLDRAAALEPDDASVNMYYAQWLIVTGYTRLGIERLERTLAIDPMLPNALNWRGYQYSFAGDQDTAQRLFERAEALGLRLARGGLQEVARARGDYATSSALAQQRPLDDHACLEDPATSMPLVLKGSLGGDADERTVALRVVDECLAANPDPVPIWAVIALMHLDEPDRALAALRDRAATDDAGVFFRLWSPLGRAVRRAPQFAAFAREVGFAEVWDEYGPPDLCRKADNGDYVCE